MSPLNSAHSTASTESSTPYAGVYSIGCFLTIQALMKKLRLSPADCLQILADVLADLDGQIIEYEAAEDELPFPPMTQSGLP